MNTNHNRRSFLNSAGTFSIILCCLFIPLSTSFMAIASAFAALFWIASGKILALPQLMLSNRLVMLSMLLLLLLLVAVAYSPAPLDEAMSVFKKYRELIFFAMVTSIIMDNDNAAKLAEDSFVLGCVALMLISYGMYTDILPLERYGDSLVYHIIHSFFMAVLAFWTLQRTFDSHQYVYLWLVIFILSSVNLFFITPGRTGMFIYILLIVLTIFQRLPLRYCLLGIAAACMLVGSAWYFSANFSGRVHEAIDEIRHYQPGESRTSLGQRFDWWHNSLELIEEKPIFGHGTGSFRQVQAKLIAGTDTKATDNPHNEYLLIGVQTGLVGMTLYCALLVTMFLSTFQLNAPRKYLLQGVVVAMASGCLMNSLLFDSLQGHFFTIIAAVLCTPAVKSTSLTFRR